MNALLQEPLAKCALSAHLKLHHLGFVVASIRDNGHSLAAALAGRWDENIIFDPIQGVNVSFIGREDSAEPLIELVEPAGPASPVSRFLQRGGGLHHLCYETPDLEAQLSAGKALGTVVVKTPVPAIAFGGRRIAWALTRNKLLLEFLETQSDREPGPIALRINRSIPDEHQPSR